MKKEPNINNLDIIIFTYIQEELKIFCFSVAGQRIRELWMFVNVMLKQSYAIT